MAKVMISMPDDLLASVDSEAARRKTTRSGLLQDLARREVGRPSKEELMAKLEEIRSWSRSDEPFDVVEEIHKMRDERLERY